jgi:multicopper oxidase
MEQLDELRRLGAEWMQPPERRPITRRTALTAVLAGGLGVGAVGAVSAYTLLRPTPGKPVDSGAIARVEAARRRNGTITSVSLKAQRSQVDVGGGRVVTALTYDGQLPGRLVRATAGDLLKVDVTNQLDQPTSVHWHGLAIRNDMDGVPDVTTPQIEGGTTARYEFVVPDAGTYWFHPHTGLQLDWGLYAPLIIDSPTEPGGYDHELVVVLDDWSPGIGQTPEQILADLLAGRGSMGGMAGMEGMSGMNGSAAGGGMAGMSDAGDVEYPVYLANGRLPADATRLDAKPGQRVRLRIINAAADTTFDLAVGGHRMTVTHSDGFPVQKVEVDTLRLAMGERYDASVTLADGVFPLVAVPVGKTGTPARVLVRTGAGTVPDTDVLPAELGGRRLALPDLVADSSVRLPDSTPDSVQGVVLAGDMSSYRWTINGRSYDDTVPLTVRQGQATRLRIVNRSMMLHPIHLHGHTFAVRTAGRPRKDTVLVPAMGRVDVDLVADNPGRWMLHCHNAFHMDAGMMTRLDYLA